MRSFRRAAAAAALGLGLVMVAAEPASAQGLGARGGVNVSNLLLDRSGVLATEARVDMVVGGFVTFRTNATVGLQVEAQVSRRTVRFESTIDDTMTYLELPVMVRVGVYRGGKVVIHGLGGASVNYLLLATETVSGGDPNDIKQTLEPWEIAAVAGAEVEVKGRWIIGARFFYGLTQPYRAHADFPARQQGYQITAGYRFR